MSNYYTMQDAKVRIVHELMKRGWNVLGYHADESDSMTDYYSPAYWNGIAIKNGYILVVDNSTGRAAQEITRYNPAGNLSFEDKEKISKLEQMTTERGCTPDEENAAKQLINRIKNKVIDKPQYEVIGTIPAYMGNPSTAKWHIEKDGKIYDKGTGITKYADMPNDYEYDIVKMEFTDRYKQVWTKTNENGCRIMEDRKLTADQEKIINEFKNLILRFERIVNNMNTCGDGTAETAQKAAEQQAKTGYTKITVTDYKAENKAFSIEKPETITAGMYFILNCNFNHGCSKGTVYHINSVKENPYNHKFYVDSNRMNPKLTKILTGLASSNNRFYVELDKLLNWIEKGSISFCKIEEVKTTIEVEKWVKTDDEKPKAAKRNTADNTTAEPKQSKENTEQTAVQQQPETAFIFNYTVTQDTDTRDNSVIYVLKIADKLSREDYIKASEQLKALKGYYSKFKHGFIFKYDPSEVLQGSTSTEEAENTTEQQEQSEDITADNQTTAEAATDQTSDKIIDMSDEIIFSMGIDGETMTDNEQYKTALYNALQADNIIITDDIINNINILELDKLAEVLKELNSGYWKPIQDGFLYDCHFKQWDLTMQEIRQHVTALNIPFIDWMDKIGFKGITAEQARQLKEISNINGSIFFIDDQKATTQQPQQQEEKQQTQEKQQQPEQPETNNKTDNIIEGDFSNMFNSDDILNKFDDIKIDNNKRIDPDDEAFCIAEQEKYNNTLETLNKIDEVIKSDYNSYLSSYDFNNLEKLASDKKEKFIHHIINHFTSKYKITIDAYAVDYKYKNKEVNYNILVDEVFEQLGGFSFTEKAVNEIKDNMKKQIRKRHNWRTKTDYWNITVKNNKIILDDIIYASKDYSGNTEFSGDRFRPLAKALSHFDCNSTNIIYRLQEFCQYTVKEWAFDRHDLNMQKAKTIKIYKNSKIEIEFKNSNYATEFAKEYCGFNPMTANAQATA